MEEVNIYEQMLGKVFDKVLYEEGKEGIIFFENGKPSFLFYHEQDCCEDVHVEDIVGDLSDLEGSPLLEAEEYTSHGEDEDGWESITYTYYKFSTIKGSVSIRWYGSSNGYYSESVDFLDLTKQNIYISRDAEYLIKN